MNTEKNIVLAKFLKYDFTRFENEGIIERQKCDFFDIEYKSFSVDELNFNSDWNSLMEVVETIDRKRDGRCLMDNDDILAYVTIEGGYCEIRCYEGIFEPEDTDCTKIEAVFSCCFQFAEWYLSKPELQC